MLKYSKITVCSFQFSVQTNDDQMLQECEQNSVHKSTYCIKFIYSEKATKVRWRFRKILWPSQNIWTLHCIKICLKNPAGQPIYFAIVPTLNRGRRSSSAVRCAAHSAGSEAAAESGSGFNQYCFLHRGPPAQWAARRRQCWRRQHQRSEGSFLVLLKSVSKVRKSTNMHW